MTHEEKQKLIEQAQQIADGGCYVVELEKGVWLASALFDPKTTPNIKHAMQCKSVYAAKVALAIAIKNAENEELFPDHLIYDPEKQKLIEQAQQIADGGCYVVELEKGVWLASALFDPKTTPNIKHAMQCKSVYAAKVALAIAIKNAENEELFPDHLIYDPEKQKLIEQAQTLQSKCEF